jgi:hypothetical protein
MKTAELTGAALDWAVAKCEKHPSRHTVDVYDFNEYFFNPSTDWSQGGPIIEREKMDIACRDIHSMPWKASIDGGTDAGVALYVECGPTPLIAAMRCFVASKLGDEIEIPEELK